jgi:hypothetical protein
LAQPSRGSFFLRDLVEFHAGLKGGAEQAVQRMNSTGYIPVWIVRGQENNDPAQGKLDGRKQD